MEIKTGSDAKCRLGAVLGRFWDGFGTVLGRSWGGFGAVLGVLGRSFCGLGRGLRVSWWVLWGLGAVFSFLALFLFLLLFFFTLLAGFLPLACEALVNVTRFPFQC